jgi:hypothetical protein
MGYIAYIKKGALILKLALDSKATLEEWTRSLKKGQETLVKLEEVATETEGFFKKTEKLYLSITGRLFGLTSEDWEESQLLKPVSGKKHEILQWIVMEFGRIERTATKPAWKRFYKNGGIQLLRKGGERTHEDNLKMVELLKETNIETFQLAPRRKLIVDCECPFNEEDWDRIKEADKLYETYENPYKDYKKFAQFFVKTDLVVASYFIHKHYTLDRGVGIFSWERQEENDKQS